MLEYFKELLKSLRERKFNIFKEQCYDMAIQKKIQMANTYAYI